MDEMIYLVDFFGDIADKSYNGGYKFMPRRAFPTLDKALAWLATSNLAEKFDPEDDRITITEFLPSGHGKVVWHASGWHWEFDAKDLTGGPLEQGKLPGHELGVYGEAMVDL
jgi:hypothetical protein